MIYTLTCSQVINLPQIVQYQTTQPTAQYTVQTTKQLEVPVLQTVKIELDANLTIEQLNEHLKLKGNHLHKMHYI